MKRKRRQAGAHGPAVSRPAALTIAGSDSGGGAGIQADLRTFSALGVHPTSAITCVTAQNPRRVAAIQACRAGLVGEQIRMVCEELRPRAAKTGMLYSGAIMRAVAEALRSRRIPLVVDPVAVATSGERLLRADAIRVLEDEIIPLASIVTPNLAEVELLLGSKPRDLSEMRDAAREFHARFRRAVLVKGGHLPRSARSVDIFYDGRREFTLAAPYLRSVTTHGSGCTLSAAITAHLARGADLVAAVKSAKRFVTSAIRRAYKVGATAALDQSRHIK